MSGFDLGCWVRGRLKLEIPFQTTLYIALHQGRIFLILVKPLNSSQ
nr:MAG TPA: hypothetical protein [Inoviridae sp.]